MANLTFVKGNKTSGCSVRRRLWKYGKFIRGLTKIKSHWVWEAEKWRNGKVVKDDCFYTKKDAVDWCRKK